MTSSLARTRRRPYPGISNRKFHAPRQTSTNTRSSNSQRQKSHHITRKVFCIIAKGPSYIRDSFPPRITRSNPNLHYKTGACALQYERKSTRLFSGLPEVVHRHGPQLCCQIHLLPTNASLGLVKLLGLLVRNAYNRLATYLCTIT